MHVAAAVGTPFVALFGPTDPRRHVLPADNCVIFRKDLACSPCYHTYCNKKYACMYSIKPEGVYKAILKLLDIGNKGSKTEFLATKPDSSRPGKTKNMMNSDLTAADGA
jgi:hypothetical protein